MEVEPMLVEPAHFGGFVGAVARDGTAGAPNGAAVSTKSQGGL